MLGSFRRTIVVAKSFTFRNGVMKKYLQIFVHISCSCLVDATELESTKLLLMAAAEEASVDSRVMESVGGHFGSVHDGKGTEGGSGSSVGNQQGNKLGVNKPWLSSGRVVNRRYGGGQRPPMMQGKMSIGVRGGRRSGSVNGSGSGSGSGGGGGDGDGSFRGGAVQTVRPPLGTSVNSSLTSINSSFDFDETKTGEVAGSKGAEGGTIKSSGALANSSADGGDSTNVTDSADVTDSDGTLTTVVPKLLLPSRNVDDCHGCRKIFWIRHAVGDDC